MYLAEDLLPPECPGVPRSLTKFTFGTLGHRKLARRWRAGVTASLLRGRHSEKWHFEANGQPHSGSIPFREVFSSRRGGVR